jgi:hypothetical protein
MQKLNDALIDSLVIVKYTKLANNLEISYLMLENEITVALI